MSINTRGGGNSKMYLNVYSNELVLEYEKKEDLEKRVVAIGQDPEQIKTRKRMKGKNEGKEVFYYILNDIGGMLTGVKVRETDKWGEMLDLELTDVDEKYSISLGGLSSRLSKDFIRRVGNLDVSKELILSTWSMDGEGDSTFSGVTIYQEDKKVEYDIAYKDLPPPTQKGRNKKWDFTEQDDFLFEIVNSFIKENFKESVKESSSIPEKKERRPRAAATAKTEKKPKPF